jgi:Fungal specific transcription factor domain
MAEHDTASTLLWVHSTTLVVSQNLETQKRIRKHAMKKAAAARKQTGNYGKHNLRQYPVYSTTGNILVEDGGHRNCNTQAIPRSVSQWGYELLRSNYDFDALSLSTLASVEIGRATNYLFLEDPSRLLPILGKSQPPSYFSFLPSRYEHSPYLMDAVNCAVARARQIISPTESIWKAKALTSYVKALNSLQKALDLPEQRLKPEVLCAIEILGIYEVCCVRLMP